LERFETVKILLFQKKDLHTITQVKLLSQKHVVDRDEHQLDNETNTTNQSKTDHSCGRRLNEF